MQTAEIRKRFLDYFKKNNHTVVESSSLVPEKDPTLLFANAGMNQFKDLFLGKEKREYQRATSCQKVVRAGGKHNDLENVGFTARHHTFFEMLGNFSFGDYFKKDAIRYAWEFSTKHLQMPIDKLHVTVHEKDDEAADIWHHQEGVAKDRIHRLGDKDNFWQMGDTGPCGPCSELFVDRGERFCEKQGQNNPNCKVGCDCDRYMEFWNLVFMQYDRDASGTLTPLPKPSVDTGAGLERVAAILQGVDSNYETDTFADIIQRTAKLANQTYDLNSKLAPSFRVVADHARSSTFLIADGVIPANEGRGYVLRRIIRRAVRHGRLLGFDQAFLYQVCGFVIDQMRDAYPNLQAQRSFIERCVKAEEEQFLRTLEHGLQLLDEVTGGLPKGAPLSGEVAFKLYDTYGFPLDLTTVICRERGIEVDEAGFDLAMQQQKSRSREHWKGAGAETGVAADYHAVLQTLRDKAQIPEFVGYQELNVTAPCVAILSENGESTEAVFAKTPFYGEGGGQVGDRGKVTGKNFAADVIDVQRPLPELIVVKMRVNEGHLNIGERYEQQVAEHTRHLTACNHTATHLLNWALRTELGAHVKQAGSLVTPEMLRFDFTHFQALTADELQRIEALVNERIWNSSPVQKQTMAKDAAIAAGAVAMFGEKYGDEVRVVSVGDYAVELCGGTHVDRSGDLQLFKIVSESGVAAGVRRMIAYTNAGAFQFLNERYQESRWLRERLKATSREDVEQKIERQFQVEKELRKQIEDLKKATLGQQMEQIARGAQKVGDYELIVHEFPASDDGVKTLRDAAEDFKAKSPRCIVVLGMKQPAEQKAFVLAAAGRELQGKWDAGQLIRVVAPLIEGRGGGKPDMAQAGGSKIEGLAPALLQAESSVKAHFSKG